MLLYKGVNSLEQDTYTSYSGIEVAELLKVSGSTLRKWCMELEEQGYFFVKGNNDQRFFNDRDIIVLRRVKDLIQVKRLPKKEAIKSIISIINHESRTEVVPGENNDSEQQMNMVISRSDYQILLDKLEKQEEFNKILLEKLEQQHSYIDNTLKERDEQLMIAMKQSLEGEKQLTISEEKSKSWWKRLFKI